MKATTVDADGRRILTQDVQDWVAGSIWNEDNARFIAGASVSDDAIYIETSDGYALTFQLVDSQKIAPN